MTGYELSRQWFDFAFENPEKINPNHTAMYFFAIEHCNRLGWKEKFGFPSTMAMEAIGVKSYNTYKKTLDDLIDWGFFKLVEKSKNQYSSNIIALSKNDKAPNKALDKALSKHSSKQSESKESINKPITIEPITNKQSELISDYGSLKKMEEPLTVEQEIKLLSDYPEQLVKDTLLAMDNWKGIEKKNKSTYYTCRTWMNKDLKNNQIDKPRIIDGGTW